MSWVVVQRLPQEDNRIVGTWTFDDSIEWYDLRHHLFVYFCKGIARSSGMQSPRASVWSVFNDTGCLFHIRVTDEENATDIESYNFSLFKTYDVDHRLLQKEYDEENEE